MLRNCLAAALRHLGRHRLFSIISVLGLAIGLCTALLAALVIHNQYSFNHDMPAYARTYAVVMRFSPPGIAPEYAPTTGREFAAELAAASPEVAATTRLFDTSGKVTRGAERWNETIFWADPNLFEVLPPAKRYESWFPGMKARVAEYNRLAEEYVKGLDKPNVRFFRVTELVEQHAGGSLEVAIPDGFHWTPYMHGIIGGELAREIIKWADTQEHLKVADGGR